MNKTYPLLASLILMTSSILAQDAIEIAKKTFPSTVSIVMQDKFKQPLSLGSGFIVKNGKVVTNVHVIKGAVYGEIIEDDTKQTHKIVGYTSIDNNNDLVILSVPTLTKSGISIVNKMPVIGERIYAIGNPKGLAGTISDGIVSGIRDIGNNKLIQITAPISPGSSGGPVVNQNGEVIGVSVASLNAGQNLNFAVPGHYINQLILNDNATVINLNIPSVKPGNTVHINNDNDAVFFSDLEWVTAGYSGFDQFLRKVSITNGTENWISDIKVIAIVYNNNYPVDYFEFTMFKDTQYGNEDLGFGPIKPFLGKSVILEDRTHWNFRSRSELDFMFNKDKEDVFVFRILDYKIIEK